MKLYATTTSERASKGQGGNEYLEIEILDENQKEIARIYVKNGKVHFMYPELLQTYSYTLNARRIEPKGKQQKSEKCYCSDDDLSLPHYH